MWTINDDDDDDDDVLLLSPDTTVNLTINTLCKYRPYTRLAPAM